ncbi:MAG: carbohydrate ABC transporter permease, partial [Pseudomonadota bacterium]
MSSAPLQPTRPRRWTEPARIGEMSPLGSIVTYSVLIFWSLFVLFPLYWVVITSFKLPLDVNAGPVYLPFIDFTPDLHAWRDVLVTGLGDTTKPYVNSIIIAFFSTIFCVLIGSMAAYALARIEYRPRFGIILLFVLCLIASCIAVGVYGLDWR